MPRTFSERYVEAAATSPWVVRGTIIRIKAHEQMKCTEENIRIRDTIKQQREIANRSLQPGPYKYDPAQFTQELDNAENRQIHLTGYDVLNHRKKVMKLQKLTTNRVSHKVRTGLAVPNYSHLSSYYVNTWNNSHPTKINKKQSKREVAKRLTEQRQTSLENLQRSVFRDTGIALPKLDLVGPFINDKEPQSSKTLLPTIDDSKFIEDKLKLADACDLGDMRLRLSDAITEAATTERKRKKRKNRKNSYSQRKDNQSNTAAKTQALDEDTGENTEQKQDLEGREDVSVKSKDLRMCPVKELALPKTQEVDEFKPSYSRSLLSIYRISCLPPLY